MDAMLNLSYGQIEALITGMLDVDPKRTSAVTARFNALRRMQFPDGVNLGATGRFKYDLEATFKCLLLFALLDALLMPQQAVSLLRHAWPDISPAIHKALSQLTFDGVDLVRASRPKEAPFLVLEPAALEQLREPISDRNDESREEYRPAMPGQLTLRTASEIGDALTSSQYPRVKPAMLTVDLFNIVSWTASATVRAGWAVPQSLGAQIAARPNPTRWP